MADRLAATLALDEPASRVKLVSPARAQALAGLGVRTVRDLLTHFPRRYIDLSKRETVAGARIGGSCTIQGRIFPKYKFQTDDIYIYVPPICHNHP